MHGVRPARATPLVRAVACAAGAWLLAAALPRCAHASDLARDGGVDSLSRACERRFVRTVALEPRDIFDPLPEGRLRGAYAIANALHVRTRPSTLRTALVFHEGARWSADAGAESMRKLRALGFVSPDPLQLIPVGEDSLDVRVVTHDNWTTSPEVNLESAGGQQYGAFAFTEKNLLGLGTGVSLAYRHDPAGISRDLSVADDALLGTHVRAAIGAGNGANGDDRSAELLQPFWSEGAAMTAGGHWSRSHADIQLFAYGEKAAEFKRRIEETELVWGTGRRTPSGVVQRFTASFIAIDREFAPSALEPGAPDAFAGGTQSERIHRVAGEMRLWHPSYLVRRGVDQLDRDEDFDLGPDFAIKLGIAPVAFGSSFDEGYVRARLAGGRELPGRGFATVRTSVETRLIDGFRETLSDVRLRWVQQPGRYGSLVTGALIVAGKDMPRDFQLTLGGLTGLRAYPVRELSGDQVARVNSEWRWVAARDLLQLVSLGGAVFYDAGRAWGAGAEREPWHQDAGFGLRLSLPHSTVNAVARFDIAWPIAPTIDGRREPVFSFGSGQEF